MTKNMTTTELFQLRELLQKWENEYTDKEKYFADKLVHYSKEAETADDEDVKRCLYFYSQCKEETKKVRYIIREVEFQIEDETGEVLVK